MYAHEHVFDIGLRMIYLLDKVATYVLRLWVNIYIYI